MGSPLLADPFHTDRWDYVFTIRRQGAQPQLRRVIVRFKADVLESVEGGAGLPSEHDFVTSIDTFKTARNAPPLVLTDEQSGFPAPVRPAAARAASPVPRAPIRRSAELIRCPAVRATPRPRVHAGASAHGPALIEAVADSPDLALSAAFDVAAARIGAGPPRLPGRPARPDRADPAALAASEVLIASPAAGTLAHLALLPRARVAAVVGTTASTPPEGPIAAHADTSRSSWRPT